MLPVLLLLLSLCNAQWPIEGFGYDEVDPFPRSPDHADYPYENESQWVENIPNLNIRDVTQEEKDAPQRESISSNPDLKLPDVNMQNINATFEALDPPDSSSSESDEDMGIVDGKDASVTSGFSMSSTFSKFMENVTMSKISSLKDKVTNLANHGSVLRNDTDLLMDQLNLLYINLAIDDTDNEVTIENSYKYGMSVILRFLFEFYRIFRKLSSQPTRNELQLEGVDVYGMSYASAVEVIKQKKDYSPLEISAPVRRSFDIFKSILYESVIIIQTKCGATDPNWKCILVYLANLMNESVNCPNVWYHAFVHMLALVKVGIQDSFVYKIAILDKFKELAYFENIFDFIIEKIQEYREDGKVQLSAEAVFFTMLADLQESGLLDCVSIDYLYN